MTHLIYSWKILGKTFKLQKDFLNTEMNHDEIDENNWKGKIDESVDFVKNDVLSTAFSYGRYSKAMQDNIGFSMKDSLSRPGLSWKYFNSLRSEDELIYRYNDKYLRYFVIQSIKGRRMCVFNQCYESKFCKDILKTVSEELNVKGIIYDIIEAYLN